MSTASQRTAAILESLKVDTKACQSICEETTRQINAGLVMHKANPHQVDLSKSNFMMLDSGIRTPPTGNETGVYYGVDMGGTNVRAVRVELTGENQVKHFVEESLSLLEVPFAKHLPRGVVDPNATAPELFDGVAHVVRKLMISCGDHQEGGDKENQPKRMDQQRSFFSVGFTCSFGFHQKRIDCAIVNSWSKDIETGEGPDVPEEMRVIGKDVCLLLNQAFERASLPAKVTCVLNDTISTLLFGSLNQSRESVLTKAPPKYDMPCRIGAIVGTGYNICYYEPSALNYAYEGTIINAESGGLKLAYPRICADAMVDFHSANPGRQLAEKCISGHYLGEVLRYVLIEVLQCDAPEALWIRHSIHTSEVAAVFNTPEDDFSPAALKSMERWLGRKPTCEEQTMIKKLSDAIFMRSAYLVGSMLAGFVRKTDHKNGVTIGVDGSMYIKNPKYQQLVQEAMDKVLDKEMYAACTMVSGGSFIGAALLAACVHN